MKNVVLLAPYFLPRRRVGSWRPFKFAIHLKEFGWKPFVITIKDSSGTLTEKEQHLLSDIPVYEIAPPFDLTKRSGSQMEKEENQPGMKSASQSIFDPVLDWVDKNFPIDTWWPLFLLRKGKVEKTIEAINPDVLWSTGDPWSGHWLAGKLAKRFNLPWVADFRDPWTLGDVNLKKRSRWSAAFDQKAEKNIIKKASVLTFTSQSTEELYRGHYGHLNLTTATIYNCFDSKLYDAPTEKPSFFEEDKLNLLFFGKFRRLSPARLLIDILVDMNKQSGNADQLRVHSFGELSHQDRSYARQKGVLSSFEVHQPVPGEEALSMLRAADILWLSTDPDRRHIIPAKLWDYLGARRPIVSVAPNPEIAEILNRTGAGVQIDHTNRQKIADILGQSILAKQQGKPLPVPASFNEAKINEYEATHATRRLAEILDQLA